MNISFIYSTVSVSNPDQGINLVILTFLSIELGIVDRISFLTPFIFVFYNFIIIVFSLYYTYLNKEISTPQKGELFKKNLHYFWVE
jgi:hypothetical protein